MNVIVDPQGRQIPGTERQALTNAWTAAGFKTAEQRKAAWDQGYRFARLDATGEREYEVEIVRTIRVKIRVPAASAAEIRKRVNDAFDSYADDLFHEGVTESEGYHVASIKPIR